MRAGTRGDARGHVGTAGRAGVWLWRMHEARSMNGAKMTGAAERSSNEGAIRRLGNTVADAVSFGASRPLAQALAAIRVSHRYEAMGYLHVQPKPLALDSPSVRTPCCACRRICSRQRAMQIHAMVGTSPVTSCGKHVFRFVQGRLRDSLAPGMHRHAHDGEPPWCLEPRTGDMES